MNFSMAIGKGLVYYMYPLPKMTVIVLILHMRQLTLGTNIDKVQIIVLRNYWIRIKTCSNSRAKCFMFERVTIG